MAAAVDAYAAFPAPKSTAQFLPRTAMLELLKSPSHTAGRDFLLVDLRRADHVGGTIQSSMNLPAQTLHPSIPTLYALATAAGVTTVIFYCGSSAGRGARAAAWLQDHIDQLGSELKSVALEGGIKGWVKAGDEYTALMDGYDAAAWT